MAVVHMKSSDAYMALEESGKLSGSENSLTSNVEQVRFFSFFFRKKGLLVFWTTYSLRAEGIGYFYVERMIFQW